ncbi:predicted protein [Lichtheimia corymbifera JMRC:FSU:9682]|uniref:Uncharacterized protein n=1 Tax=Lichtheimia corymbifera JMRC:FSU:9682 TaxID=1263082 RepID=A0A068SIT7_9FUNG|nr:predicted protein [Lichtheimia corymbifera JMRC:FSU:9682]
MTFWQVVLSGSSPGKPRKSKSGALAVERCWPMGTPQFEIQQRRDERQIAARRLATSTPFRSLNSIDRSAGRGKLFQLLRCVGHTTGGPNGAPQSPASMVYNVHESQQILIRR